MPGPLKTCLGWASRGSDSPLYWSGNEGPESLGNFPKVSWSHGKREVLVQVLLMPSNRLCLWWRHSRLEATASQSNAP